MKRFFKFLGRTIILWLGCYVLSIIVIGFFPTQISTCNQLFTGLFYRVSAWAPFMSTVMGYLETVWNWIHKFLPYFGSTCGVLIVLTLVKWACKIRVKK